MVCRIRSTMAASVGVMRTSPPPASTTSRVRIPLPCSTPPSGCDRSRSLPNAVGKSVPSRSRTSTLLPRTAGALAQVMRASRSVRNTSSRRLSRRCLRMSFWSTSSRMCEPPWRSRPSTSRRCAHAGQPLTICSGKKFGIVKLQANSAVSRIAAALAREKYNIAVLRVRSPNDPSIDRRTPSVSPPPSADRALFVLHRLALSPYISHHAAHLPHSHAVGDFDLDLVVVHDLGDLSDQPTRGDECITATHVLNHFLMLLRPLLLGPQNEEIHDDKNKGERQQLIQQFRAGASHALCVGRCNHANNSPLRVSCIRVVRQARKP